LLGRTVVGDVLVIVRRTHGPLMESYDNPVDKGLLESFSAGMPRREGGYLDRMCNVQLTDIPAHLLDERSCGGFCGAHDRLVHKHRGESSVDSPVVRVSGLGMGLEGEEVQANKPVRRNVRGGGIASGAARALAMTLLCPPARPSIWPPVRHHPGS